MNSSEDNTTVSEQLSDPISDSIWILTSTFMIFTMQSGFGLLESGSVSVKNEVNIMIKNAVDVIFGGLTYWMFGYGLSFGDAQPYTNPFCGWGYFFVHANETELGWVYSKFFFQASFATTATTIVSGSMAERTRLEAYILFSMLNTFVFCFPAHWIWASDGWLHELGVIDIAGAGPVHLVGGITGLVATMMLKPRHARFSSKSQPQMGSPTNAILGMFMLWWGWLGFNCGSTFGISGLKWKLAARSAVATIMASIAGGIVGFALSYIVKDRRFDVSYIINALLGSLVGITATCALSQPWEAIIIGTVGGMLTIACVEALNKLKIDDPVGCIGVHAACGIWSMLAAGLFTHKNNLTWAIKVKNVQDGLFVGGQFHQLGVQTLGVVVIVAWTVVTSYIFLKIIDVTIGIRVPLEEELLGADIVEHAIGGLIYDKKKKLLLGCNEEENDNSNDSNHVFHLSDKISSSRFADRKHSTGIHSLGLRASYKHREYQYNESQNTSNPKMKTNKKKIRSMFRCFDRLALSKSKKSQNRKRARRRDANNCSEEVSTGNDQSETTNNSSNSSFDIPDFIYDFPDLPFRKLDSETLNLSASRSTCMTYL